jgi:HK97 family phage major capsid protein
MAIKTQEELNAFAEKTAKDLEAVIAEKAGVTKELAEAKSAITTLNGVVQSVIEKQARGDRFEPPKDHKKKMGEALKAIRNGNLQKAFECGYQIAKKGNPDNTPFEADPDWIATSDQKTALGSYYLRGDATTGSYVIPVDYAREILDIPSQTSVMMGKVTQYPVTARTTYIPITATKPSVAWPSTEVTDKSEGIITLGQKTLSIKTVAVYSSVTDEMIQDAVADMGAFIKDQFQQSLGTEIDKQVLVASTAPFVGMTKDTGVNSVVMTGITDFSAVTWQHFLEMENAISAAVGENALQGAVIIMHRKVFNYLRAKTDDVGNPLYQKPADNAPATIYGYPYILSDQMPKANATTTGFIILGNPKNWVMGALTSVLGDFRVFDQTNYTLVNDQIFFRLRARLGFVGARPDAFAVLKTG